MHWTALSQYDAMSDTQNVRSLCSHADSPLAYTLSAPAGQQFLPIATQPPLAANSSAVLSMARSTLGMVKTTLLIVAACALLTSVSATFVMIGDSFSDDGHGASPIVQDALSTPYVRFVVVNSWSSSC